MATRSPFFTPRRLQNIGELLYFAMQLLIGQGAHFSGFAFPNDGGFIFARALDVPIEAVVGKIELAADEPLGPGKIPFQNLVPLLEPMKFFGDGAQNPSGSSTDSR